MESTNYRIRQLLIPISLRLQIWTLNKRMCEASVPSEFLGAEKKNSNSVLKLEV